jgi:hypoxia up-regulated 1
MPRSPQHTYQYLSQLLGKSHNSSAVEALKPYLLYADEIVPNGERGTVAVQYNANTTYAVEDLAAMVFNFARETALAYVHSPVSDVVITVRVVSMSRSLSACMCARSKREALAGWLTRLSMQVPPHWTAEERAAVVDAAELGGFHVLSLINDGTAVALHYAFGKRCTSSSAITLS